MKKSILIFCFVFFFQIISSLPADSKEIIGWLETIVVYPGELKMRAKMDTGAKSSSLNVYNLKKIQRDQETWVTFEIQNDKNKKTRKTVILEKKIVRTIKIKQKDGGIEKRITVMIEICLGGVHKQVETNLIDRSNFNYQFLIGRDDLEEHFIVDPSATFTHKPFCKTILQIN